MDSMASNFWNDPNSFNFVVFKERSNNWGKKNFWWGVILRVYKKAHFVDKIWTVWKIYKSLKSCIALQNLKQQETTVIFLKQVFIKVIGYSWCGIRRKKITVRKLYWTWHKSEVCNLGAEGRASDAYTQYLRASHPAELEAGQNGAGGRRALQGPRAVLRYCSANVWNPSVKLQGPLKQIPCKWDRKHMFLRTFWLKLKMWQRLCQ